MSAAPWKTALVTGASSGMGRGLAVWLSKRGVKVYAAARRLELLEALKAEAGELIVPLKLDVSDADATFAAVEELDAESGGLDLVIANAGVGDETRPRKLSWGSIKQMIDVNVTGATATICGAHAGDDRARPRATWWASARWRACSPLPVNSTYCATKSFLDDVPRQPAPRRRALRAHRHRHSPRAS